MCYSVFYIFHFGCTEMRRLLSLCREHVLFHVVFQGASVVGGQDADEGGVVEDEGGGGEEGEDGVRPNAAQRSDKVTHTL